MSQETCDHNIELLNLREGDLIRQSILIIHGKIINHECSKLENRLQILLYRGNDCFSEFCEEEFKFILELPIYESLADGEITELDLRFVYCTVALTLKLKLQKPRSAFRLQPIYILCSDEDDHLIQTNLKKIDVNLRLVQALYANRIRDALGYGLTFVLNDVCQTFRSNFTKEQTWNADEHTLWNNFAEELLRNNKFGDGENVKLKIVAFIGCTKYDGAAAVASGDLSYSNIRKYLKGHAALGGGDLAIFGSRFFYAWPDRVDQILSCLKNARKIDPTFEPDESNYRKTYLGVYATTLGAVCHELGHIFDCGHDGDGIMGSGFDFVNRLLTITNGHTENLPKRTIGNNAATIENAVVSSNQNRYTKLKRNTNGFLDNYREQRTNFGGFYFTRNCAIILSNNKWFMNNPTLKSEDAQITFDAVNGIISCKNQALKIIEIRSKSNSFVENYFEIKDSLNEFQLEKKLIERFENTHYLYVLTQKGESARFELVNSDSKEQTK